MSATKLVADLRAAGLHVIEEPGWMTRGGWWAYNGRPEGVMQHHTAPPNPYPIKKLYGPPFYRTKANLATHEDGTVYLIAYKACNYSSGLGMLAVLKGNVRLNIAPVHNATKRGLKGGNRHFWNQEHSHPGDGSPIPQVQFDTIIVVTQVVNDHFEIYPAQGISHAEWTKRKIDPYWNGSNRTAIEQIRAGVAGSSIPMPPPQDWTKELIMALPTLRKGDGFRSTGKTHKKPDVKRAQGLLLANGYKDQNTSSPEDATDGLFGSGTDTATRSFQSHAGLTADGVIGKNTWTKLLGQ